jgi:formamidopyrimidine-DNA glycosylase
MPELPEVETTRRGITPHVIGQRINAVVVRNSQLRWPVPDHLATDLPGHKIERIDRRGKYLLFYISHGCLLVHLGMSGSLRITSSAQAPLKHDHIDIALEGGQIMRYSDPRRFGCMLWLPDSPQEHPLLKSLGPEPLDAEFSGKLLFKASRGRRTPVKSFIMDSHTVVGVGNIYANESLYMAGIRPDHAAGEIGLRRYIRLASCIRKILADAISQGGTSLRDFVGGDGKPGYFKQSLLVYGRGGEVCRRCQQTLREIRLGQRSTVFCVKCQR